MNALNDSYFFKYSDKVDNGSVISIKTIKGRYFHIPRDVFFLLDANTSDSGLLSHRIGVERILDLHRKGLVLKDSECNVTEETDNEKLGGIILLQGYPLNQALRFFSLFGSVKMVVLYFVALFSFCFLSYDFQKIIEIAPSASKGMGFDILVMLLIYILFSGVIHELGHSSLLYKYQKKQAKIGITFNYCFPAFFADVRDSALLVEKKQKLAILFAGVFYQIIFFPIIVYPFYLWLGEIAVVLLCYMLMLQVFFNLVPFLRNDGYWLYREMLSSQDRKKRRHIMAFKFFLALGLGYFSYVIGLTSWGLYTNLFVNNMHYLEQSAFDIFRQCLISMYLIVGAYDFFTKTSRDNEI